MLRVSQVTVKYDKHIALSDVAIEVDRGEIVVILGANGAGKTTLLNTIAGLLRPSVEAAIVYDQTNLLTLPSYQIVSAGVALVPEGRGIFPDLTVKENLQLGAFPQKARKTEATNFEFILELFPRLRERLTQVVLTMSGGEQQMVAIGRAVMSNPDLLLLDEPSLGLSPIMCSELFGALTKIGKKNVGILLVEQNALQSLKIADRGYIIETGRIVGQGSAEFLQNDPSVGAAYLGASVSPRGADG